MLSPAAAAAHRPPAVSRQMVPAVSASTSARKQKEGEGRRVVKKRGSVGQRLHGDLKQLWDPLLSHASQHKLTLPILLVFVVQGASVI